MAKRVLKKMASCPECGHSHKVEFVDYHYGSSGTVAGVHYRRITPSQFETTINVPGELVENQTYLGIPQQMFLAGSVGLTIGALLGHFASIPWHLSSPQVAAEIIVGSAFTGGTLGVCWLAKERAWQLGRALPAEVNRYFKLSRGERDEGPGPGPPQLTVDHRYETGRTIQYFGPLPVEVDRFNEWAQDALMGKSLAIAHWTGKGKLFSRQEYEKLLNQLKVAGTVINVSGKGNQLTGGGKRALALHLKQEGISPPSPSGERA
jgi:hypothetical protein